MLLSNSIFAVLLWVIIIMIILKAFGKLSLEDKLMYLLPPFILLMMLGGCLKMIGL